MNWLTSIIQEHISKKDIVLDLGCGKGNVTNEIICKSMVGVDVFSSWLEEYKGEKINKDIRNILFEENSFDVVLALDIIEHLTKQEALDLIKKMEKWARKKVIIYTPREFKKQKLFGNPYNQHKCLISKEELEKFGYTITELENVLAVKEIKQENLQFDLDSLDYPPTHTYILDQLKPTGVLKERVEAIKKAVPDFFTKSERFLDVGCNKGFFSLYGSKFFKEVIGIDSRKEFIDLCDKLKKPNTEFVKTGFRSYITNKQFDRVLIGNTHHYIFRECGGWDWIVKLAVMTKPGSLVLIEGPVDMTCGDMFNCIPEELRDDFNYEKFKEFMSKFFKLKLKQATVGYTPGRHLMLFERLPCPMDNKFELKDLPVIKTLKPKLKEDYSHVYESTNDLICKVRKPLMEEEGHFRTRIQIASLSPISNNLLGMIYEKGNLVGWVEKKLKGKIYKFFENEKEIFKALCRHQIFLARNNYFDFDSGCINFANINGELKLFDKCLVHPINRIRLYHYKEIKDVSKGRGIYFSMLKNSYKTISGELLDVISKSMSTKDSVKIESAYKEVLRILENKPESIQKEPTKISVIIPVYNQKPEYFKEAIESVINQTIKPHEIIIVDDGSDKNISVPTKNAEEIKYTLLRNKKNMGIGFSRQRGVDEATGDYIAFLSSDDIWDEKFLEVMIKTAKEQPNKILYSSNFHVDAEGKIIMRFDPPSYYGHEDFCIACWSAAERNTMFCNFSCVFIPKAVFEKVKFDKNLRYCEDIDFLLRSMKHFTYFLVNQPLLYYRAAENLTSKIFDKIPEQNIKIRKKCMEYWKNG